MSYTVGFLIYDGFDLQDLAVPYSILAAAGLPETPLFSLHTVARTKELVTAYGGMKILPDHIYPDAEIYDAILIPGGPGYEEALKVLRLMNWINQASRLAQVIAAVHTGVYLLAAARLLGGQTVAAIPGLADAYNDVEVVESDGVVRSGKLFTISKSAETTALANAIIEVFQL